MESVILLNQDFSFLAAISWKRAINLIVKGKAEAIDYFERTISNYEKTHTMKVPKIVKLVYFIKKVYKLRTIYSRRNVLLRDGFECAYCGSTEKLTVDHIVPKAKGGKTSFENCVACCHSCNCKKDDKALYETGMKLQKRPYAPSVSDILRWRFNILNIEIKF